MIFVFTNVGNKLLVVGFSHKYVNITKLQLSYKWEVLEAINQGLTNPSIRKIAQENVSGFQLSRCLK